MIDTRSLVSGRTLTRGWIALVASAGALVLFGQLLPGGPLRALFVAPPLLFVPGFAAARLIIDRSHLGDLAVLAVFSFGLSLGILILDALVLNAVGIRLSAASLGITVGGATALLVGLNLAVGRPVGGSGALWDAGVSSPRPTLALRLVALSASLCAALGAVYFVANNMPAPAATPFVSISLGPSWAARASAPLVRTGERLSIPVVATSHGATAGDYSLVTSIGGTSGTDASLALASSGSWHGTVFVRVPTGRSLQRLTISLRRVGSTTDEGQLVVYLDHGAS